MRCSAQPLFDDGEWKSAVCNMLTFACLGTEPVLIATVDWFAEPKHVFCNRQTRVWDVFRLFETSPIEGFRGDMLGGWSQKL